MRAATCAIGLILLVSTAGGIGDARPRQQKSADANHAEKPSFVRVDSFVYITEMLQPSTMQGTSR